MFRFVRAFAKDNHSIGTSICQSNVLFLRRIFSLFLLDFYSTTTSVLLVVIWMFKAQMSTLGRAASYFITTPIYYVNSKPHIGHLYSSLLADTIARWQTIKSRPSPRIIFSTGTDEHGLKIERAAAAAKLSPKEFCDQVSGEEKYLRLSRPWNDSVCFRNFSAYVRPIFHQLYGLYSYHRASSSSSSGTCMENVV